MSHEFQHQFGIVCVPPVKQDICIGHKEHIVLILGTRIQQPERDDIKIQGKNLVWPYVPAGTKRLGEMR